MIAKQLRIAGRVQGVGYRDWLVTRARGLGLSGWVRNRLDGTVEALIAGDTGAINDCIRARSAGPRVAIVNFVSESPAEVPEALGFTLRPTL